jgi:hypothetical protein
LSNTLSLLDSQYLKNISLGQLFNPDNQCKLIHGSFSVANICPPVRNLNKKSV